MRASEYHTPVMVDEVMRYLTGGPGIYFDGTVGGGGHAAALLEGCSECSVVAVDRDEEALAAAAVRLESYGVRVRLAQRCFSEVADDGRLRVEGLAGALLDLGVSSRQLESDRRGFTFRREAPLDMRMDGRAALTAELFLATAPRRELAAALRAAQAPKCDSLAARIVRRRDRRPLRTSNDLVAVLESVLARRARHAEKARLFQALRMRVNDEIGVLKRALPRIRDLLRPGSTFVVIAYHSVEDRIVKRAFGDWSDPSRTMPPRLPVRELELTPLGTVLTRKPVRAGAPEVARNPRSRAGRLRAWRKAA